MLEWISERYRSAKTVLGLLAILAAGLSVMLLIDNPQIAAHTPDSTPTPIPSPTPFPQVASVICDAPGFECGILAEQVRLKQAEQYHLRGYLIVEYRDVEEVKRDVDPPPDIIRNLSDWREWVVKSIVELGAEASQKWWVEVEGVSR